MSDITLFAAVVIIAFLIVLAIVRGLWAILTRPKLLAAIAAALLFISFLSSKADAAALTGGGGSADWFSLMTLAVVVLALALTRRQQVIEATFEARIAQLEDDLIECTPPEFALRDVMTVWHRAENDSERLLIVKFQTYAGMLDFHTWLQTHVDKARA